jgi:hypothetical protein
LKSNIIFQTLSQYPEETKGTLEPLPDIIFMCVNKQKLNSLCQLFPQTAENIKRKALERRFRLMQQKNLRSYRIEKKKKAQKEGEAPYEEGLKDFHSDEEPENT